MTLRSGPGDVLPERSRPRGPLERVAAVGELPIKTCLRTVQVVAIFVVTFGYRAVNAVAHFIGQFDPTEASQEVELII